MSLAPRNTTIRDQHRRAIRRTQPACGICEQEIDYSLRSPDPMSFEVDHIVPLSVSNDDTLANKQATHRKCNRDKWDRVAEDESGPRVFVTSRTW